MNIFDRVSFAHVPGAKTHLTEFVHFQCSSKIGLYKVTDQFILLILTFYSWMHVFMLSHFNCVLLFVTPWTTAHQAPLSMGFSR